jgi:hypothetical protein
MVADMAMYGTVIRIFSETSLLVNIGAREGLTRGDRLVVIERGDEIRDPKTGESLGGLELIKAELTAVDVQERMSILRTERTGAGSQREPLSTVMARDSMKPEAGAARMSVSPGELAGIPAISPVRVGDSVRVVG